MTIPNPYTVHKNPRFVNRIRELEILKNVHSRKEASLIVVSGRRRIGKTELIEQFFIGSQILKFEGIQHEISKGEKNKANEIHQISNCCHRLAKYVELPAYAKLALKNWTEFFELLVPYVRKGPVVLYFEEIQWLASYSNSFTAELKPFWDDHFRHNPELRIIFSGSAPSFIARQFLRDSALYNRSTTHIFLDEFSLANTQEYLAPISTKEALVAQLLVGGVPEYLRILRRKKSALQIVAQESFAKDGFFFLEHEKIFVSSMAANKHYRSIIELLSKNSYLSRDEILKSLKVSSTGSITKVLHDLEDCGFIMSYTPLESSTATRLTRYCVKDAYLQFYYRFVKPQRSKIMRSVDKEVVLNKWIQKEALFQSLGFAFERWSRTNAEMLARIMKFDQVNFSSGSFFSRKLQNRGVQIDLMFKRDDYRLVVCEVKYSTPSTPLSILKRMRESTAILKELHHREFAKYSVEYALIVGEEIDEIEKYQEVFDYVVDLKSLSKSFVK
jgi:uncharacterized protein